jgi:hypothetical protein
MNCQFCNKELIPNLLGLEPQRTFCWYECAPCSVSILVNTQNNELYCRLYRIKQKDKEYIINTNLSEKIVVVGMPNLHEANIVVKCEYNVDNITPSNISDKLKLLINFL